MTRELKEKTVDGVELYAKVDAPECPKAVVVVVHGLCEHQGRYNYVTQYLNERGFKIYRFDHRGHGRSKGQRVYYENREIIIEDVNIFVDLALKENPGLPVFLLGHSMGGYAVACYGTKYPGKVKGIILSGAWTRDNKGIAKSVEDGLDPLTYIDNQLGDGVCSDKAVVEIYVNDPLVEKKISLGLFYSAKAGHKWLKENAEKFTDPTLVLHGANDALVAEKDSREFFSEIGSTDKTLFIYSSLYHEILNEPCKDKILGHITEWLNERS
jgi:alpha-beta hydrolase superfamily lysophospholipase